MADTPPKMRLTRERARARARARGLVETERSSYPRAVEVLLCYALD